ncbi:hypothetical protein LTR86_003774 [Recurvomyces mirabilis]|nr:hypothetical protein LTR86_003774 [Recurvomyces mirabilis]
MTGIICSGKTTIYTHTFNSKLTPVAVSSSSKTVNAAKDKIHTAPNIVVTPAPPTLTPTPTSDQSRNSTWQGVSYVSAAKCRAAAATQTKTPSASKTSLVSRVASTPAMNHSKAATSEAKRTVSTKPPMVTSRVIGSSKKTKC